MRIKEYFVKYPDRGLVLPTPFIIPVIRTKSALQSSMAFFALILLILSSTYKCNFLGADNKQ